MSRYYEEYVAKGMFLHAEKCSLKHIKNKERISTPLLDHKVKVGPKRVTQTLRILVIVLETESLSHDRQWVTRVGKM